MIIQLLAGYQSSSVGPVASVTKMAAMKFLLLAAVCIYANALPQQPKPRNTIFGDERLKGEIFDHVDEFTEIALFNDVKSPYRLPTTTKPVHYNVLWHTNMTSLSYSGTVEITLVATEPGVSEIVIHSDHTELTFIELKLGNTIIPFAHAVDSVHQLLTIRPNINLAYDFDNPVEYTLTIDFNAEMRNDMYGIYKNWYRDNTTNADEIKWMASTQYQSTASRYAFPCYDEPKFKATFNITIRRPTNFKSWTGTRLLDTVPTNVPGYVDDIFYTTPKMSTYLLAIIVADYDAVEHYENGLLMYEVIARPGAIKEGQGKYAFDVGMKLLAEMSAHTGLDYYSVNPNLKMTQAAIPDFSAGAMENWGLLTYREAYVMYDEEHTSGYFKQIIAYILSHEIAHMWFGNLVTCDWWDTTWLNEGFARYYQYFLTNWVEEDMGFDTRYIVEQVHTALLSDSSNNPHPLTNPGVASPNSVSAMFSTISYNKGSAIIRMTEHLLGHEVHREGLRNYLVERSFQSVIPINLFEALQSAAVAAGAISEYGSDFSLVDYYKTWTEQGGHPVLLVQVNHQTGNMTITQRKFNINTGYSVSSTNWIVPITFSTASNPDFNNTKPSHIIKDSITVINRGSIGDEWVIFNKQQTGYYRVNYDDYTWDLIILALRGQNRTLIHEYNRAQIVNDVFQFARSGIMSYSRAFNILSFLQFETDYAPWVTAVTGFSWIRNRLAGTPLLNTLNNMIASWAATVMNDIGYTTVPGESFMKSYLRYQLAPVMCSINVPACRTAASSQFRALVDNEDEVAPDNRNWVYCNGLRDGNTTDFEYLWKRFQTHNVYTEKILLLQVLGCAPDAQSINTFLTGIVEENFIIRPQDYSTALNSAVTGNEGNTQIAFQFMKDNLELFSKAFGNVATPLSYVSSRLRSETEVNEFQTWATQNQAALGNSYQAVYNGAESSRNSIQWAITVTPDINNYIVNGDITLQTTTEATTTTVALTTTTQPTLIEPESPVLTDSATTTFVSAFLITFTVIFNLVR